MAPFSTTEMNHLYRSVLSVRPHLRVTSPYLVWPDSFRGWVGSVPSRYSTASIEVSPKVHSLKPACVMPPISTRKRKFRYGSTRSAMVFSYYPIGICHFAANNCMHTRDLSGCSPATLRRFSWFLHPQ